jgi:hypothetical protein
MLSKKPRWKEIPGAGETQDAPENTPKIMFCGGCPVNLQIIAVVDQRRFKRGWFKKMVGEWRFRSQNFACPMAPAFTKMPDSRHFRETDSIVLSG